MTANRIRQCTKLCQITSVDAHAMHIQLLPFCNGYNSMDCCYGHLIQCKQCIGERPCRCSITGSIVHDAKSVQPKDRAILQVGQAYG